MAASNWGTDRRLDEFLFASPCEFEFFQAVRLLKLLDDTRSNGLSGAPHGTVRFRAHNSLGFPASEISNLEPENGGPPTMEVSFLGMTGPRGALPTAYTEIAIDRECLGDRSFADFLDVFNHRLIELFFEVWQKHRFVVSYERNRQTNSDPDDFTSALFDLIGMGTSGLRGRMPIVDLSLLYYAGLLAQRPRSAEALRAFLSDYFGLSVKVQQFVGKWHTLEPDQACNLGSGEPASQLGGGAVAGDAVWSSDTLLRVVFGPLTAEQFSNFVPDSPGFAEAISLVRWFLGGTLDFEIQPALRSEEVPPCVLGNETASRLGWSAWLRTEPFRVHATDSVFREDEQVHLEA